jgi:hypothetical protein
MTSFLQTSDLLDGKISLAHAGPTHINQVIKSQELNYLHGC